MVALIPSTSPSPSEHGEGSVRAQGYPLTIRDVIGYRGEGLEDRRLTVGARHSHGTKLARPVASEDNLSIGVAYVRSPILRSLWKSSRVPSRSRPSARKDRSAVFESLESRLVLAGDSFLNPTWILPTAQVTDDLLVAGEVDYYRLETLETGQLSVLVANLTGNVNVRVSLHGPSHELLATSMDVSLTDVNAALSQSLFAGEYFLTVSSESGTGSYSLTTQFLPGPFDPREMYFDGVGGIVLAVDIDGDGHWDLIAGDDGQGEVAVGLGNGDGTFRSAQRFSTGSLEAVVAMAAGDLNGDGHLDLVTANRDLDSISVLFGNGDGTFAGPMLLNAGTVHRYLSVVTGDFDDDGHFDVAATRDGAAGEIVLWLGNGDGTFQAPTVLGAATDTLESLQAGDLNGDGFTDLVSLERDRGRVVLLLSNGDGTFTTEVIGLDAPGTYSKLKLGDFDGDGATDLMTVDMGPESPRVFIHFGRNDGTFQAISGPSFLAAAADDFAVGDFNGDGRDDIVSVFADIATAHVYLAGEAGTFSSGIVSRTARGPISVASGDFNGDGRLDLVTGAVQPNREVSVLLGNGDGTIASPSHVFVPIGASVTASADLNKDGLLDLIVANSEANTISVLLGQGNGGFVLHATYQTDQEPSAIAIGDLNRDGRLDVVVANRQAGTIAVYLGIGDGGLRHVESLNAGGLVTAVRVGDFNNDGRIDLASVNADDSQARVFLGNGDGSFGNALVSNAYTLTLTGVAVDLIAFDFNKDHVLDLAVSINEDTIAILRGRGDGTFHAPTYLAAGLSPTWLAAGDFDRDGNIDLAVANQDSFGGIGVLRGNGNGTFAAMVHHGLASSAGALFVNDVDGDGNLDLATITHWDDGVISVLLGNGSGGFAAETILYTPATNLGSLAPADFNNDGQLDFLVLDSNLGFIHVLFGGGNLDFETVSANQTTPFRNAPIFADLNVDGLADVAILDARGQILVRLGLSNESWQPPLLVNAIHPARDMIVTSDAEGVLIVALDQSGDYVRFYRWFVNGIFLELPSLATGGLASRIASADLDNDGHADLVVSHASSGRIQVFLGTSTGHSAPLLLEAGYGPVDSILLVDVNQDGLVDILVSAAGAGETRLLVNRGDGDFESPLPLRAGQGPYVSAVTADGTYLSYSLDRSSGVASGDWNGDGRVDLAVANAGSNTVSLLFGTATGGFTNPTVFLAGNGPTRLVGGDFNHDGHEDLAVLNEGSATITLFLNDGTGMFVPSASMSAGVFPTGIATRDVDRDGHLDLVVSSSFGDVLVLRGRGDGTFEAFERFGRDVTLAVADLDGDGKDDLILGNQGLDRVHVQYSGNGASLVRDRNDGVEAPAAPILHDLNGDGIRDLIVINTSGNGILVYLGQSNGQFGPANAFFTGTRPSHVAVADLNEDGLPDVVVTNQGSNDLTVLFGSISGQGSGVSAQADDWTFVQGPRLAAGFAPTGVFIIDINEDGIDDLMVTNGQEGTVRYLPGVGNGFFNEAGENILSLGPLGSVVVADFTGDGRLDLIGGNPFTNGLTFLSNIQAAFFTPQPSTRQFSSSGSGPELLLVTDFNRDGISDLIVGNRRDGSISLYLGSSLGMAMEGTFYTEGLTSVSGLAVSTVGGWVLYATGEGDESIFAFTAKDLYGEPTGDDNPFADFVVTLSMLLPDGVASLTNLLVTLANLSGNANLLGRGGMDLDGRAEDLIRIRRAGQNIVEFTQWFGNLVEELRAKIETAIDELAKFFGLPLQGKILLEMTETIVAFFPLLPSSQWLDTLQALLRWAEQGSSEQWSGLPKPPAATEEVTGETAEKPVSRASSALLQWLEWILERGEPVHHEDAEAAKEPDIPPEPTTKTSTLISNDFVDACMVEELRDEPWSLADMNPELPDSWHSPAGYSGMLACPSSERFWSENASPIALAATVAGMAAGPLFTQRGIGSRRARDRIHATPRDQSTA